MKILLLIGLSIGLNLSAQHCDLLGDGIINPSLKRLSDTTIFYSKLSTLSHEIGLYESEIGTIYKLNNKYFHSSVSQYGYKNYKVTQLNTRMFHQLSHNTNLAVNINYHHLYIAETASYNAISFDVGFGFTQDRFALYLWLENPLNAEYLDNDIESRILLSPFYLWNENLSSKLNISVSLHNGMQIQHRLTYIYQDKVSLGILQGIKPFEYGFNIGYTINKLQFYTQFQQLNFRKVTSFIIIYTLGDA